MKLGGVPSRYIIKKLPEISLAFVSFEVNLFCVNSKGLLILSDFFGAIELLIEKVLI